MITSYRALRAFLKHVIELYERPSQAKFSSHLSGLLDDRERSSVAQHYRALRTEVRENLRGLSTIDKTTYLAEALAELKQSNLFSLSQRAARLREELTASEPPRMQTQRVKRAADFGVLTLGMFLDNGMEDDAQENYDNVGLLLLLTSTADRYVRKAENLLSQLHGQEVGVAMPLEGVSAEESKAQQLVQMHEKVFVSGCTAAMCEQVEQALQLAKKAKGQRGFAGVVRALVDALIEARCIPNHIMKPQVVAYFGLKYEHPGLKDYPDKLQERRHEALLRKALTRIEEVYPPADSKR